MLLILKSHFHNSIKFSKATQATIITYSYSVKSDHCQLQKCIHLYFILLLNTLKSVIKIKNVHHHKDLSNCISFKSLNSLTSFLYGVLNWWPKQICFLFYYFLLSRMSPSLNNVVCNLSECSDFRSHIKDRTTRRILGNIILTGEWSQFL